MRVKRTSNPVPERFVGSSGMEGLAPPPLRVKTHEPTAKAGSQAAQPHLEDGSVYRQNRPTIG